MTFNRPLKRGLPLILFEDVSMIQRSKEDGIITPGGLILVQKSSVRDSIIDSITSLESFSLVHSICSMNYEDGMYEWIYSDITRFICCFSLVKNIKYYVRNCLGR